MATISGRVVFDRDRSATISSGDSGLAGIPVVLQNIDTSARLTVLTDAARQLYLSQCAQRQLPDRGILRRAGGTPDTGDFSAAVAGSVPEGVNPPIGAAVNPPPGSTNLDSVTPDTLLVTVAGTDLANQNFLNGPVIYTPIQTILDSCAVISGENLIRVADDGTFGAFPQGTPANTGAPWNPIPASRRTSLMSCPTPTSTRPPGENTRCRTS